MNNNSFIFILINITLLNVSLHSNNIFKDSFPIPKYQYLIDSYEVLLVNKYKTEDNNSNNEILLEELKNNIYNTISKDTNSIKKIKCFNNHFTIIGFFNRKSKIYISNNDSGALQPLNWHLKKYNIKDNFAIMNAGMYLPNGKSQGLLIESSKIISQIDSTTKYMYGNFYLYPNGVFYIDSNSNSKIEATGKFIKEYNEKEMCSQIKFATQSGPLLILNDSINKKFNQNSTSLYIRNGVGITKNNETVFVISEYPINFFYFAILFKDILSCKSALYLDGAISKCLYNTNKYVNVENDGLLGPSIIIKFEK